jgi:hypothetical protein
MKPIFTSLLAVAFLAASGPVLAFGNKEPSKQAEAKKVIDKKGEEKKAAEDKAAEEKKAADDKSAAAKPKKKKKEGC